MQKQLNGDSLAVILTLITVGAFALADTVRAAAIQADIAAMEGGGGAGGLIYTQSFPVVAGSNYTMIYQEVSPRHPDRYFGELLRLIDLRGVFFAPQVCDLAATGDDGDPVEVAQDRHIAAVDILAALRRQIEARKSAGAS